MDEKVGDIIQTENVGRFSFKPFENFKSYNEKVPVYFLSYS